MADPVISDAMVEAYRDAAAATPCPACGRVPQCRCLIPDGGRESYRVRRGLRAAIAQFLAEQDERHNGCCRMGICQYDRDCPGYATCTLGPVEEDR